MKIKFFSFYSMFFLIFSLFQIGCAYATSYGTFTLKNNISQKKCTSALTTADPSNANNAYCKYQIAFMHDSFVDVNNGQEQSYVNAPGVFAQIVFCVASGSAKPTYHCTYVGYIYPTAEGSTTLNLEMPSCTYTRSNGSDLTQTNCTGVVEKIDEPLKFAQYPEHNANPSSVPAYTPTP